MGRIPRRIKMPPIPCAHCGFNFMRVDLNPDKQPLCNNCFVKEELRNPKQEKPMKTIEIKIQIPLEEHKEIEEICINEGLSFSSYFLSLYHSMQDMADYPIIEPNDDMLTEKQAPLKNETNKKNSSKKVEK